MGNIVISRTGIMPITVSRQLRRRLVAWVFKNGAGSMSPKPNLSTAQLILIVLVEHPLEQALGA